MEEQKEGCKSCPIVIEDSPLSGSPVKVAVRSFYVVSQKAAVRVFRIMLVMPSA